MVSPVRCASQNKTWGELMGVVATVAAFPRAILLPRRKVGAPSIDSMPCRPARIARAENARKRAACRPVAQRVVLILPSHAKVRLARKKHGQADTVQPARAAPERLFRHPASWLLLCSPANYRSNKSKRFGAISSALSITRFAMRGPLVNSVARSNTNTALPLESAM